MKKLTLTTFLLSAAVLLGVLGYATYEKSPNSFGSYIAATVQNTSTTVQTVSTTVVAAGENLQRLVMKNPGPGQVFCAFGATPVLGAGMVLDVPNTTSTNQERDITDPSLLTKKIVCIASGVSSTLYITKYSQ